MIGPGVAVVICDDVVVETLVTVFVWVDMLVTVFVTEFVTVFSLVLTAVVVTFHKCPVSTWIRNASRQFCNRQLHHDSLPVIQQDVRGLIKRRHDAAKNSKGTSKDKALVRAGQQA